MTEIKKYPVGLVTAFAQQAGILQEVVELCESGEFDDFIFLNFIREGFTSGLINYTRSYQADGGVYAG